MYFLLCILCILEYVNIGYESYVKFESLNVQNKIEADEGNFVLG